MFRKKKTRKKTVFSGIVGETSGLRLNRRWTNRLRARRSCEWCPLFSGGLEEITFSLSLSLSPHLPPSFSSTWLVTTQLPGIGLPSSFFFFFIFNSLRGMEHSSTTTHTYTHTKNPPIVRISPWKYNKNLSNLWQPFAELFARPPHETIKRGDFAILLGGYCAWRREWNFFFFFIFLIEIFGWEENDPPHQRVARAEGQVCVFDIHLCYQQHHQGSWWSLDHRTNAAHKYKWRNVFLPRRRDVLFRLDIPYCYGIAL